MTLDGLCMPGEGFLLIKYCSVCIMKLERQWLTEMEWNTIGNSLQICYKCHTFFVSAQSGTQFDPRCYMIKEFVYSCRNYRVNAEECADDIQYTVHMSTKTSQPIRIMLSSATTDSMCAVSVTLPHRRFSSHYCIKCLDPPTATAQTHINISKNTNNYPNF